MVPPLGTKAYTLVWCLDPILSPRGTFHKVVKVLYLVILTQDMFTQEETLGLYLKGSVVRQTRSQGRVKLGTHTLNSRIQDMDCLSNHILGLINRVKVSIHRMQEFTLNRAKEQYPTNSILAYRIYNGTRITVDNLTQMLPLVEVQAQTQVKYTRLRLVVKDTKSGRTTPKTGSLISQISLAIPLLPLILKEGRIPVVRHPTTNKDRGPLARDLMMGVSLFKVTAIQCLSTRLTKDRTLSSNLHGRPIKLRILNTQPRTLTRTQLVVTLEVELLITLNWFPSTHKLESTRGTELSILGVIRTPILVGLLFLAMLLTGSIFSPDHPGKMAQHMFGQ